MDEDSPEGRARLFSILKEKVLSKRPILREILIKRGYKSTYEYSRDFLNVNLNPPIKERQGEFISAVADQIMPRLGRDVAESVARQLQKYYFVSTSDHHGPTCSPNFLNANLVTALQYHENNDPILENLVVLCCANISLSTNSFPRGLLFNSFAKGETKVQRLAFLPANSHSATVYNFRAYLPREIKKIKDVIREKKKNQDINSNVADKLVLLIDEIYDQRELFEFSSYSDQIIRANYYLWKKFFASSRILPANLIYIEQESLVKKLLIERHLCSDTIVKHIIFDPAYDDLIIQYFEGIMGTFSRQEKYGTYLFWGVSKEQNYRVQLWKRGNALVSDDGTVKIPLAPEAICEALEKNQILPNMMLIYIVLCFYYGLKCLGGFNQVNYLTFMKNAYIKMAVDRGNYKSIEACARAQTKEINDGPMLAYIEDPRNHTYLARGLDLYLYGNDKTWYNIVQTAKNLTLDDSINTFMPKLYEACYTSQQRESRLSAITDKNIIDLFKYNKKIIPCANIL